MPDRRPTCLIEDQHAWSKTNMPDRRPTCLIWDRHAWSETDIAWLETDGPPSEIDMPVETHLSLTCLRSPVRITHLFKYTYFYILFAYLYWNDVRTLEGMSVSDQECQSPMSLCSGMSVSDETCTGLRSGMSFSDGSPLGHQY